MPKDWFDDDEFVALRDAWYAKLKEEGFEDIEILDKRTKHPGCMLKGVSPGDLRRGLYKPETEEYYRIARRHVWKLHTPLEREIWRLHAEGHSRSRIVARLGTRFHVTRSFVSRFLTQERERMFRLWQAEEERIAAELREFVRDPFDDTEEEPPARPILRLVRDEEE